LTKQNKSDLRLIIILNLFIGMYNLYLWVEGNNLFNLIVGSVNIGIWVFYRSSFTKSDDSL